MRDLDCDVNYCGKTVITDMGKISVSDVIVPSCKIPRPPVRGEFKYKFLLSFTFLVYRVSIKPLSLTLVSPILQIAASITITDDVTN